MLKVHCLGSILTDAYVLLLYVSSLPVTSSIKIPPQNVTVKKGSLVPSRMTCVIVGDYDGAKTPWTHNNDVVKNGSGVTVERLLVGDGVVVHWLTFVNVMNDSIFGIYTCGVESDGISATATLINETPGEFGNVMLRIVAVAYSCTAAAKSSKPLPVHDVNLFAASFYFLTIDCVIDR